MASTQILRALLLVLVALISVAPPWMLAQKAEACSCARPEPRAMVERSEAIVLGTVTDARRDGEDYIVTFAVDEYLHGNGARTIELRQDGSSMCGLNLSDSFRTSYLFGLVEGADVDFNLQPCSGSAIVEGQPRADVDVTIDKLRELRAEAAGVGGRDSEFAAPLAGAGVAAGLALAALAAIRWRSTRAP